MSKVELLKAEGEATLLGLSDLSIHMPRINLDAGLICFYNLPIIKILEKTVPIISR